MYHKLKKIKMKKIIPYLVGAVGLIAIMKFMPKIKEKIMSFLG